MVKDMKETEIQPKIIEFFKDLVKEIQFVQIDKIFTDYRINNSIVDTVIETKVNGDVVKILLEIKSLAEPRLIRSAIQQLKKYENIIRGITQPIENKVYSIIGVKYISDDSAQICKENGIGYIDLAGNCFLKFGKVFIERKNYPNPYKEKRIIRSIFTPKASRILRVMLSNPKKFWQLQELAKESDVSLGQAYKVKERLLDLEYVSEENRNIVLKRPEVLLSKWSENYSFRKNKLYDYFSFGEPRDFEQKIADYCEKNSITYAFTLFSGADLVAPYTRYNRVFMYIKEKYQEIASAFQLKQVDSGPNVTILEPFDDGIFYGIQEINGMCVVGNIQLYLDLMSYKGRGEETARFLLDQKVKSQW